MQIKKLIFPIISIILAWFAYDMIKIIIQFSPVKFGFGLSAFLALILNILVVGVFAFLGFAFATNKILPEEYYQVKNIKSLRFWYNILGVKYFRYLLMLAFWGKSKNRKKYFDGTRHGLKNLIYQSKQSEIGHLLGFIAILAICIFLIIRGYVLMALLATILNFIGNIYPVLLQRHHRARIQKLIN